MSTATLEAPARPSVNYTPHPTCLQFHRSNALVRGLMGPIGSGKSVACCFEIFAKACKQKPGMDGKTRYSKWAAIRATYPQLEQTTVATWMNWFGPITKLRMSSPITATVKTDLPDGTKLNLEIIFLALDRPEDRNKLTSLELTGAWINEAREIEWSLVTEVPSRLGRYPNNDFLGRWSWKGMIMDTNPPDDDSDWYRTFEEQCPSNWELFRQPGALIAQLEKDGKTYLYNQNPLAENVGAHKDSDDPESTGYEYWEEMIGIERYRNSGKDKHGKEQFGWAFEKKGQQIGKNYSKPFDWINVMICGNYGICFDGKAVFKDTWDDSVHFSKEPLSILKGIPIWLGWDFGFTHPACVVAQYSQKGQLRILREIIAHDCGLQQFIRENVRPVLENEFQGHATIGFCDPAGIQSGQRDGESCYMELLRAGFHTEPAPGNNDLQVRLNAVNEFLLKRIGSEPAFIVDPSCITIRKGFNGGYNFKRVQVGGKSIYRDVPDKNEYSHCIAEGTMISMKDGLKKIEEVEAGDTVLTPLGYKKVLRSWQSGVNKEVFEVIASNGSSVLATSEHLFFANKQWIPLDSLQYTDVLYTPTTKECLSWEDLQNIQYKSSMESSITKKEKVTIKHVLGNTKLRDICTGMFGNFITELSRMATIFTTLMRIKPIIQSKTLQLCCQANTHQCTPLIGIKKIQRNLCVDLMQHERQQKHGMEAQKDWNGIGYTEKNLGKTRKKKKLFVSVAAKLMKHIKNMSKKVFAPQLAKPKLDTVVGLTMWKSTALSVIQYLLRINTQKSKHAVKIVQIKKWSKTENVYDLEVEDAHCFFANGILVHNCMDATEYICLGINKDRKAEKYMKNYKPQERRRIV